MEYWKINPSNQLKFSKEFFDLCFQEKCQKILELPAQALAIEYNMDVIVMALLQHSPKASKKAYPIRTGNCKRGEKKISKTAQEADERSRLCQQV